MCRFEPHSKSYRRTRLKCLRFDYGRSSKLKILHVKWVPFWLVALFNLRSSFIFMPFAISYPTRRHMRACVTRVTHLLSRSHLPQIHFVTFEMHMCV